MAMGELYWKAVSVVVYLPWEATMGLALRWDVALTIVASAGLYLGLVYLLLGVLQGRDRRQRSGMTLVEIEEERRSPLGPLEDEAA